MRKMTLLSACLVCEGHGWYPRRWTEQLQGSGLADSLRSSNITDPILLSERAQNARGALGVKELVAMFLALNPAAVFNTCAGNSALTISCSVILDGINGVSRAVPAVSMIDKPIPTHQTAARLQRQTFLRHVAMSLVSSLSLFAHLPASALTTIELHSVADAVAAGSLGNMAKWPDPILRRVAAPVRQEDFGPTLDHFARMLVEGMESRAIAAIQYGVNAQIIALRGESSPLPRGAPLVLVNPRILDRSDEERMKPWLEICLVLPPGLQINLFRDEWVKVEAKDTAGRSFTRTLRGEPARAFQHEYDHIRGVLIVDHADIRDLPPEIRDVEKADHIRRQLIAYQRIIGDLNAQNVWPSGRRNLVDSFEDVMRLEI